MVDWLVEVTTSFSCEPKTYFLAIKYLDKTLLLQMLRGQVIKNEDILQLGVQSLYLASKFEDVQYIDAKLLEDKVAQHKLTFDQIIKGEKDLLSLFDYDCNEVTHYDFLESYFAQLVMRASKTVRQVDEHKQQQLDEVHRLVHKISLYLTKMAM